MGLAVSAVVAAVFGNCGATGGAGTGAGLSVAEGVGATVEFPAFAGLSTVVVASGARALVGVGVVVGALATVSTFVETIVEAGGSVVAGRAGTGMGVTDVTLRVEDLSPAAGRYGPVVVAVESE